VQVALFASYTRERTRQARVLWCAHTPSASLVAAGAFGAVLYGMREHVVDARVQWAGCSALASIIAGVCVLDQAAVAAGIAAVVTAMRKHAADPGVQVYGCVALSCLTADTVESEVAAGDAGAVEADLGARASLDARGATLTAPSTSASALSPRRVLYPRGIGACDSIRSRLRCTARPQGFQVRANPSARAARAGWVRARLLLHVRSSC
jgi:hypothetical protein